MKPRIKANAPVGQSAASFWDSASLEARPVETESRSRPSVTHRTLSPAFIETFPGAHKMAPLSQHLESQFIRLLLPPLAGFEAREPREWSQPRKFGDDTATTKNINGRPEIRGPFRNEHGESIIGLAMPLPDPTPTQKFNPLPALVS